MVSQSCPDNFDETFVFLIFCPDNFDETPVFFNILMDQLAGK